MEGRRGEGGKRGQLESLLREESNAVSDKTHVSGAEHLEEIKHVAEGDLVVKDWGGEFEEFEANERGLDERGR